MNSRISLEGGIFEGCLRNLGGSGDVDRGGRTTGGLHEIPFRLVPRYCSGHLLTERLDFDRKMGRLLLHFQ